MKSGILTSIVMAVCMMLISGCASLDSRSLADKLERSVTQYASALRWAYYREAIGFHVTRDEKSAAVNIEHLENFSVTSFDIISQTLIPSSEVEGINEAVIVAEISYFHKGLGYVRKLKLNQIWWHGKETKHWLIETDFPEFK